MGHVPRRLRQLAEKATSGDDAARAELAQECGEAAASLREDDDPRADRVTSLCDQIGSADGEAAWEDLREEVDGIDEA